MPLPANQYPGQRAIGTDGKVDEADRRPMRVDNIDADPSRAVSMGRRGWTIGYGGDSS